MRRDLVEVVAGKLDEDGALIGDLLGKAPAGREEFRPRSGGMSLAELAGHLVMAWGGVLGCIEKVRPGRGWEWEERAVAEVGWARERLEVGRRYAREGFAEMGDEDLARRVKTYFCPEGEVLLGVLLGNAKHLNHHAYQLFGYLRKMGVEVGSRDLYRYRGVGQ